MLDEIGELELPLQAKLLRVLEERELVRVGGQRPIPVLARVLAATMRDLEAEVAAGRFREDLYYRICVLKLVVPALAERPAEIGSAADAMLARRPSRKMLSPCAHALLASYAWPGGFRELRSVIARLDVLCDEKVITAEHVHAYGGLHPAKFVGAPAVERAVTPTRAPDPPSFERPARAGIRPPDPFSGEEVPPGVAADRWAGATPMTRATWVIILQALERAGGVKAVAARIAGGSRQDVDRALVEMGHPSAPDWARADRRRREGA